MKCGSLLSDSKFQFPDGSVTNKFIIVICEFGNDYLVVQATQQQLAKNKNAGCQINDKPPNYYLDGGGGYFTNDTWIRLDEVFEYNSDTFFYKREDGVVYKKADVDRELMKNILKCSLQSDDIDLYYIEFIERAYDALCSN